MSKNSEVRARIWHLGGFIPGVSQDALRYRIRSNYTIILWIRRPICLLHRNPPRSRIDRLGSPTPGVTGHGCGVARRTTLPMLRYRSTRCISVRGGRCGGREPFTDLPGGEAGSLTVRCRIHSCRFLPSWSTRSASWATRRSATSPHQRYGTPGSHVSYQLPPPAWVRGDPRLGAIPFSADGCGLSYFDGTHLYERPPRPTLPRVEELRVQSREKRSNHSLIARPLLA